MTSLTQQVLSSSTLMLATRLAQRFIGLISTLILARLLVPEDFGIVAFLAITVNLFSILSQVGGQQYIISKSTIDDADLNTAWTLNIGLRLCFWLVLLLATPYICRYFNMEIAQSALYTVSLVLLINSVFNPGFWLYKKALNYKKFFILEVAGKFISFIAVIIIALVDPSFWAMVIGDLISASVITIGSYFLHQHRPKICFKKFNEQWHYSKWVFSKGILGFTDQNIDNLLITKFFTASELGGYYLAKDISIMPATQLVNPASEPLLASLSMVSADKGAFNYQIVFTFLVITVLSLPLAAFIFSFAPAIVEVLLGDNWLSIHDLFSYFALFMFASCYSTILANVCIVTRHIKALFYYNLFSVLLITPLLFLLTDQDIEYFAIARGAVQTVLLIAMMLYIQYITQIKLLHLVLLISPVFIATLIANIITLSIKDFLPNNILLHLCSLTLVFFTTFLAIIFVFYKLYFKQYSEYNKLYSIIKTIVIKIRSYLPNRPNNAI